MSEFKFEEQLKKKLEEHEIQPSLESWGKLETRLGHKNPKVARNYWWMGIAASIVAGIFITSLIVDKAQVLPQTEVVNQPANQELRVEENQPVKKQRIVSEEIEITTASETSEADKTQNKGSNKTDVGKTRITTSQNGKSRQVQEQKQVAPIHQREQTIVLSEEIEVVLAGDASEERQIGKVTNSEVEALLKEARFKIHSNILNRSGNAVNAQALLNGVESDLDRSFREKIFKTIKDKLEEFALANRNF